MTESHEPTCDELLDSGWGYLRSGQLQAASAVADRLLKDCDPTPESLLFAGEAQFSQGNFGASEGIAARLSKAFPEDLGGPVLRCRAYMALGRQGDARDLAVELAGREVVEDRHLDILVTVLCGCMVPDAAYPLCKDAVKQDPLNPSAHRRLAVVCRLIGKIDEAVEAAEVALRFNVHDYEMIGLRSDLLTATEEKNHIAALEAMIQAGCRTAMGAVRVAFALAKECEDVGLYEQSFGYLTSGATARRQLFRGRPEDEIRMLGQLTEKFTANAVLKHALPGHDSAEPIFVLGLPRTGSTLVERILSSHSEIHAAGELTHFDGALMESVRKLGQPGDAADLMDKCLAIDPARLGRRYVERTRPYTGHTRHFIDKRPLNCMSLGMIRRALPNATVIHIRRTPMDTCYAIYKILFSEAYGWSYDLAELADFYIGYRRLMDHWREIMPDYIVDVVYENVVEDLEREARMLIDILDLDWQPDVLDFHKNEAAAMTSSAVQVRRKLYSSSVGLWKRYEKQLQPVAERLDAAGIDPYSP